MDHKPSRPCTALFDMLKSECGDSFCTSSIKGNARTLLTERLSIFVSDACAAVASTVTEAVTSAMSRRYHVFVYKSKWPRGAVASAQAW